jgi:hypothetical protein
VTARMFATRRPGAPVRPPAPERVSGASCTECGFRAGSLSDYELFVAIVATSGRYRELLARFGTLEELEPVLRERRGVTGWSALERIAHVADSFRAAARCSIARLDGGRGDASVPVHVDAPRADANGAPPGATLASLDAAVSDLARAAGRLDAGERGQARGIFEGALHEAGHHLADVEVLLRAR